MGWLSSEMVNEDSRNPTKNSREDLAGLQLFRSPSGWSFDGQRASQRYRTGRAGLLGLLVNRQLHSHASPPSLGAALPLLILGLGWELQWYLEI